MGRFDEAAIADYRLSFADQGKKTEKGNGKQTEVAVFR
jgi:hypothetical protein